MGYGDEIKRPWQALPPGVRIMRIALTVNEALRRHEPREVRRAVLDVARADLRKPMTRDELVNGIEARLTALHAKGGKWDAPRQW